MLSLFCTHPGTAANRPDRYTWWPLHDASNAKYPFTHYSSSISHGAFPPRLPRTMPHTDNTGRRRQGRSWSTPPVSPSNAKNNTHIDGGYNQACLPRDGFTGRQLESLHIDSNKSHSEGQATRYEAGVPNAGGARHRYRHQTHTN